MDFEDFEDYFNHFECKNIDLKIIFLKSQENVLHFESKFEYITIIIWIFVSTLPHTKIRKSEKIGLNKCSKLLKKLLPQRLFSSGAFFWQILINFRFTIYITIIVPLRVTFAHKIDKTVNIRKSHSDCLDTISFLLRMNF